MQYPVTAFIGAGNMATAVLAGLVGNGYPADKIIASNPSPEKLESLAEKYGVRTTRDNNEAARSADVIILAVKPYVIPSVCEEISTAIDDQLILSVAAGKTIASIKKYLATDNPVIRAMPNTPCLLSKGAIGLYAEGKVSGSDKDFVSSLFENIGETLWLGSEKQIDIVTALSGSGPAYYFYLTEALINAGIELGLDKAVSERLVNQTALGAVAMLSGQPDQTAASLRKAVTSPNGTTEAAIKVFDEHNLMQVFRDAVRAGTERGEEMSKEQA